MSKNTWLALLLVLGIPLGAYFLLKYKGEEAVVMPRKYFPLWDTAYVKDGKTIYDTLWKKIPDFQLTNQLGQAVHLHDIDSNHILVFNFFFTRCKSFCPVLIRNMKILQDAFTKSDSIVRFISFSVDPEHDSVSVIKNYADRFAVNSDYWWMLTGSKDSIYRMAERDFKVAVLDSGDVNFVHTDKFVLVDKHKVIRGYYGGQDSAEMKRLADDIVLLMLEKDKSKKRNLFRK